MNEADQSGEPEAQPPEGEQQPAEGAGSPPGSGSAPPGSGSAPPGSWSAPPGSGSAPAGSWSAPPGSWSGAPAVPPDVAVPPGMYFDTMSGLVLPNGTHLAGVGRRIGAYFLSIVLAIVTLIVGYAIWGLILWPRGQTPTYQVLRMRCFRPQEARVAGFWWMALREVVGRLVDVILGIFTEIPSFILFVATKEHRSLHDLVAGTVVLHDPERVLG
jgi:uncharacterized RDD family membrane protein YckC